MIRYLFKAIEQLTDPIFRVVVIKAVAMSLVALVVAGFGVSWAIDYIPQFEWDWVNWLVEALSWAFAGIVMFLLFAPLSSIFVGLYLDDVAEAVEKRNYPTDPPGRAPDIGKTMGSLIRFAGTLILVNLVALPLYLLPIASIVIFYAINGYLMSREYFEVAGLRHADAATVKRLRKANQGRLILGGMAIAFLFSLPIVNLLAPLIATAFMVHVFRNLSYNQRM